MSRSYISVELRQHVAKQARNCCEYCLVSEIAVLFAHHVDHIVAEKHGGLTISENLALACAICNKYKGSDIASIDIETNEIIRLFNPRRDVWNEHFSLFNSTIIPLTAIGRVTVNLLQFNRSERVAERELLIKAGVYLPI